MHRRLFSQSSIKIVVVSLSVLLLWAAISIGSVRWNEDRGGLSIDISDDSEKQSVKIWCSDGLSGSTGLM